MLTQDASLAKQVADLQQQLRQMSMSGNLANPGDLKPIAGATASAGWLLCDGSAVSRTTYAALFVAIGTTHGVGDGSTTFNLPDFRGRVPVGTGIATGATGATSHTLGQKAGEETHRILATESGVPSHTHTGSSGTESTTHTHGPGAGNSYLGWDNVTIVTPFGGSYSATPIYSFVQTAGQSALHTHAITVNAASAADAAAHHNNMQPYIGVNWLVKT
jgi:microcystin-dependent protein